ncbi:MAG: hypothetical protein HY040_07555 [Planctomycetes bacterium]|nr:hypothetical protein [Planctomycetota bacterium]
MNIAHLADEALEAFWEVIVKHFPQATSGDLSPGQTMRLQLAAESAILEWVVSNALYRGGSPDIEPGYRFKLRHNVDRFPDFIAQAGSTGTVTESKTGLWAKMDPLISEAEDNLIHWDNFTEFLFDTQPLARSEAA